MEELFKKFSDRVKTREDLVVLLEEIEEADRAAYLGKQANTLSDRLVGKVPEDFRNLIAASEKEGTFPTVRKEQNTFFTGLEKYLSKLPTMKLILAFTPSDEFLTRLAAYLEKETGKKVILDILLKEEIVGGAIVEYGGEYRDYSLLKKLEAVLAQ